MGSMRAFTSLPGLGAGLAVSTALQAGIKVTMLGGARPLAPGGHCILLAEQTGACARNCRRRPEQGWDPAWRWVITMNGRPVPGARGGGIRDLGLGRFQYTAPRVKAACTFVLRVSFRDRPGVWGEVAIRVRPPRPGELYGPDCSVMELI